MVRFLSESRTTSRTIRQATDDLRRLLIQSDVPVSLAKELSEKIGQRIAQKERGADVSLIFAEELAGALKGSKPSPLLAGRVLVVGLNGAGKTTTTAKIAKLLSSQTGGGVAMVGADLRRPGAVEQLRVLGGQSKVPVFSKPEAPLRQLLVEARLWSRQYHTVLFDTAGRQETEGDLMQELEETVDRVAPDSVLYVFDGSGGQQLSKTGRIFSEALGIDGLVVTKLDGDAVGGATLGLVRETGAPIVYSGVGEKIEDIEVFDADKMSKRILGLGGLNELAEKIGKIEDADVPTLSNGDINLNDFIKTTRMIRKLGPMGKIARSAGLGGGGGGDDFFDDLHFARMEAMVNSMTDEERKFPELLSCFSRVERVAAGAGVDESSVLEFLGRFNSMRGILQGSSYFDRAL